MGKGILSGIRVLDFTRVLAGPYATRLLADFGAEVIKVQSRKIASGTETNTGGYFNTWNRNKKSITLNLSYPEAKEIAFSLTAISDVLIENFTPRVMSNWGLNYERLKAVRPDLIMLSMSGMGQTGPWKDYVAFGSTLQSFGGLTYLTSFDQESPIGPGYSYADLIAGLYGALAVLAALAYRDRTGLGQYIDLSEYEALCTAIGPALLDEYANNANLMPLGNQLTYMSAAPYGCYRCRGSDRWCVIATFNEGEWQALCKILGFPGWTKEKKFSTLSRRKEHEEQLNELIEQWTSKHTAEEVARLLQEEGVPAGVVQNAEDLASDPQFSARGYFVHLKHLTLGDTISDRSPIRLRNGDKAEWKAAPLLGEDNQYVYQELLGMSEPELAEYIEKGVIG